MSNLANVNTLLPINVLPLKALDVRLSEMAKGFEEATIDKNTQEEKTISMDKQLETAARLRKVKYTVVLHQNRNKI